MTDIWQKEKSLSSLSSVFNPTDLTQLLYFSLYLNCQIAQSQIIEITLSDLLNIRYTLIKITANYTVFITKSASITTYIFKY